MSPGGVRLISRLFAGNLLVVSGWTALPGGLLVGLLMGLLLVVVVLIVVVVLVVVVVVVMVLVAVLLSWSSWRSLTAWDRRWSELMKFCSGGGVGRVHGKEIKEIAHFTTVVLM